MTQRALLYRLNRLALYGLLLLYVPLILATIAGLCGLGYWLTVHVLPQHFPTEASHFRVYFLAWLLLGSYDLMALGVSLMLLVGLLPLLFREVKSPPTGMPLHREQHPVLHGLIGKICRRLHVREPDQCILSPSDHVSISDLTVQKADGSLRRGVRTLVIGAAFVVHLRVDELATILCHEMAHASAGDTRFGGVVHRFYRSMSEMLDIAAGPEAGRLETLLCLLLRGYFAVFHAIYTIDSRYRELLADRKSALVCGPQNVRNALIKTHLVGYLPHLGISALLEENTRYEDEAIISNLYQEHRDRWAKLSPQERERAESAMFLEHTSWRDSHPCLTDRMKNLAGIDAPELQAPQPATKLFKHWASLEESMTNVLVTWVRELRRQHSDYLVRSLGR